MDELRTIDQIKKDHDALYEKALRAQRNLVVESESGEFQLSTPFSDNVDRLLKAISDASARAESFDDYRWLSDAGIKWQILFSSIFNIPKDVDISPPPQQLKPPPLPIKVLSEEELDKWIEVTASCLSKDRRLKQLLERIKAGNLPVSSGEEEKIDWHNAEIFFASEILNGNVNFARQIGSGSYRRLEQIWLEEVKQLRAYFVWENRGEGWDPEFEVADYYQACQQIHNMLVNSHKGSVEDFKEAKAYLENSYLKDGKIDPANKPAVTALINGKAKRIWEKSHTANHTKNWVHAETYVKMFYESIIPAVMANDQESVLTVLKAFQTKTHSDCCDVINCFETALATYFLNAQTVQQLWDEGVKEPLPESCVESVVTVQSWPKGFEVPDECKENFWFDSRRIKFKGVMSELQKQILLKGVKKEKHVAAVKELFAQSRLIRQETTL